MKMKLFLVFICALVFGSWQTAEAQSRQQVRVQVNQTKRVFRNDLTIKLLSPVEDSRCAVDVRCVWAGNAKIQLRLTNRRGVSKVLELNSNIKPQSVRFGGYEIKFVDLNPKMRSNVRINPNGYVATLEVTRTGRF